MANRIEKTVNGIKLVKLNLNGCACANCGWPLEPDDFVAVCADCGGIFCESCAEDGSFTSHTCEDDEVDE